MHPEAGLMGLLHRFLGERPFTRCYSVYTNAIVDAKMGPVLIHL